MFTALTGFLKASVKKNDSEQVIKEAVKMVGYSTLMPELYVFILAAFVGYMVITRVPPLLHTPLMSATNAISAISVVGAILVAGSANSLVTKILGTIAVAAAMSNVVGGFILTDRMLKMFKKEKR